MLWLLLAVALGAPPDEALIGAVSALYGKTVPAQAICTAQAQLPAEFSGTPVAVGVTQGQAGCRLFGVLLDGELVAPADAARRSLGEAWAGARPAKRQDLLQAWTEQVLLAFDQVDRGVKPTARTTAAGDIEVQVTFWQRIDARHGSRHTPGTFSFDRDARLETIDRDRGPTWKSAFYVQDHRVDGVTAAQVMDALDKQSRQLQRCMDEAWRRDLTVQGRVRLQWTIGDGAAGQLATVEDDKAPAELPACYADAIRKMRFPEGMRGTVIWSFSIVRSEAP